MKELDSTNETIKYLLEVIHDLRLENEALRKQLKINEFQNADPDDHRYGGVNH